MKREEDNVALEPRLAWTGTDYHSRKTMIQEVEVKVTRS